jgi:hypothetical protein
MLKRDAMAMPYHGVATALQHYVGASLRNGVDWDYPEGPRATPASAARKMLAAEMLNYDDATLAKAGVLTGEHQTVP